MIKSISFQGNVLIRSALCIWHDKINVTNGSAVLSVEEMIHAVKKF